MKYIYEGLDEGYQNSLIIKILVLKSVIDKAFFLQKKNQNNLVFSGLIINVYITKISSH